MSDMTKDEYIAKLRSLVAQACVLQNDGAKRSHVSQILGAALDLPVPRQGAIK